MEAERRISIILEERTVQFHTLENVYCIAVHLSFQYVKVYEIGELYFGNSNKTHGSR